MKRIITACALLLASTIFAAAQSKTEVEDAKSAGMLLGRHKLSLQWVSWNYFGLATVTKSRGSYRIKGEQRGRGSDAGNYVTIEGKITSIGKDAFGFDGKIVTRVSHINGGKPCVREGQYTFQITGKRRYWRLQQMDNPCDPVTDYVDIYFR